MTTVDRRLDCGRADCPCEVVAVCTLCSATWSERYAAACADLATAFDEAFTALSAEMRRFYPSKEELP